MKITEQPSHFSSLDTMSTRELLEGINREDHLVADAVHEALGSIETLVEATLERMRRGGRVFYIGAGTSGRLGILDASEIPPTYAAVCRRKKSRRARRSRARKMSLTEPGATFSSTILRSWTP